MSKFPRYSRTESTLPEGIILISKITLTLLRCVLIYLIDNCKFYLERLCHEKNTNVIKNERFDHINAYIFPIQKGYTFNFETRKCAYLIPLHTASKIGRFFDRKKAC